MTSDSAATARTPAPAPPAPPPSSSPLLSPAALPRRPDAPADAPRPVRFPDYPPRSDMMNTTHLHDAGNQSALRLHLGNPETTVVLGEVPIAWEVAGGRAGVRIPDLLIAFRILRARVIEQKGYSIREQGKPPDFVLEVASDHTARNDEIVKLLDYAAFGITEYWLFDPDWGRRYAAGLIGWRWENGRYVPIMIIRYAPGMYYGWSAVLGLYVCWEHGRLRWYDPAVGYLRTHDEERSGRLAERSDRIVAELERSVERDARIAAEQERIVERDARIAAELERNEADAQRADAEAQREEAQARIESAESQRDEAQAEVQRLRDEIARLQRAAGAS